jgi:enoyl-CoA hydratase/carnithine racemase
LGSLHVTVDAAGIADVVFDRPPVNAVSLEVYGSLETLVELVSSSDEIRVVIVRAPPDARAWCGGADLNDFADISVDERSRRYDVINRVLPRFYTLDRPVIAAINGHAIGVGMILAAACDIRIASETAEFACPEIDFGLVAGGAGLFSWLKMPEGLVREMLFTGGRYPAAVMQGSGFLNHVVPHDAVARRARAIAEQIASKSLAAIRARKRVSIALEGSTWSEGYLLAQQASAALTRQGDGRKGVAAFLGRTSAGSGDTELS